jgi:RNA polymerase sigma-70 factor (ECF subfamily)
MEFAELARQQMPRLYALARQLVDDAAEDLVQECLLKAYRSYPELRDAQAAPAWLTRILVNTARDRYRHRDRRVREDPLPDVDDFSLFRTIASEDPFPYSDSLHLDFLHQFGREDVRAVLASIPELYRVPMLLTYVEGYHAKEVARFLDAPLGTILARLHRGRKLFERRLWEYAEENGLLRAGAVRP